MLEYKTNKIIAEFSRKKKDNSISVKNTPDYEAFKESKATLSSLEYVKDGGSHCPFCGSYNLTSDELKIDSLEIHQKIACLECKESWNDIYRLSGYKKI